MNFFHGPSNVMGLHTKDFEINKADPDSYGNPNISRTYKVYCEKCTNDTDYIVLPPFSKFYNCRCRKCGNKLSALYEVAR